MLLAVCQYVLLRELIINFLIILSRIKRGMQSATAGIFVTFPTVSTSDYRAPVP